MIIAPVEHDEAMLPDSDEAHLKWLKEQIEKLSDEPPLWSRTVYTPRHTSHLVFVNGVLRQEGSVGSDFPEDGVVNLVRDTLLAVTAYRDSIVGPVDLVWRIEPEIRVVQDGKLELYTRLCFEPTLICVADGMWVEKRLTGKVW